MTKKKTHPNIKDVKLPKNWGKMADGSVFGEPKKTVRSVKAFALVHGDTFIAAFRFKPKRVREGRGKEAYYAWTDCNGPKYVASGRWKPVANIIEGTMNAKCIQITITLPPNKGKKGGKK